MNLSLGIRKLGLAGASSIQMKKYIQICIHGNIYLHLRIYFWQLNRSDTVGLGIRRPSGAGLFHPDWASCRRLAQGNLFFLSQNMSTASLLLHTSFYSFSYNLQQTKTCPGQYLCPVSKYSSCLLNMFLRMFIPLKIFLKRQYHARDIFLHIFCTVTALFFKLF